MLAAGRAASKRDKQTLAPSRGSRYALGAAQMLEIGGLSGSSQVPERRITAFETNTG
jgi:hypothetical protein